MEGCINSKPWMWVENVNDLIVLFTNGVSCFQTKNALELAKKLQEYVDDGYELHIRIR